MPFNGSGNFNLVFNWEADAAAGIDIMASRMDGQEADMASNGFDNCLTRDGQGSASANLPMNGFKHTNVANASSVTDYAAYGQVQSIAQAGLLNWVVAAGTSDAITAAYSPTITLLADGQVCSFRSTAANLTTTPTFSPNGLTAETITKNGGQALAIGDICGNLVEVSVRYNLANTRWELLNPPSVPVGGCVPYFGGTVPSGFALPLGQNLSATTYPAANVVLGTTYGSPGGGNFTMPDGRGRVFAHLDSGGSGRITSAGGNFDGTVLGDAGGAQNKIVAQANLPIVNFTNSGISASTTVSLNFNFGSFTAGNTNFALCNAAGGNAGTGSPAGISPSTSISSQGSAASGGSGTPLPIVQPTMMINWMMRIA